MRGSNHQQFVRWIFTERSLEGKSSSRSNLKLVRIVHASVPSLDTIARHLPPPHTPKEKRSGPSDGCSVEKQGQSPSSSSESTVTSQV